jgi:uncharacterized coiled-coil protein SlyX
MAKIIEFPHSTVTVSRSMVRWAAGIFILSSFLIFCGAYKLGVIVLENMATKATEIAALQHKINVLTDRIKDQEEGEYYQRIAILVGGDASPGAVKTYQAVSKLNGTIDSEWRELEEAIKQLSRLTGKEYIEEIAVTETPVAVDHKIARVAGRAKTDRL